jgi:hypothetical protein
MVSFKREFGDRFSEIADGRKGSKSALWPNGHRAIEELNSHVDLLGDVQRVIDLDSEVAHRALEPMD